MQNAIDRNQLNVKCRDGEFVVLCNSWRVFFITRTNCNYFCSYNMTKKFAVDKYVDLAVAKITDKSNIS